MKIYVNPQATVIMTTSADVIATSALVNGGQYDDKANNIRWSEIAQKLGL